MELTTVMQRQDKIKYAKWKATDILKAFKEGRAPHAGPIGGPALPSPTLLEPQPNGEAAPVTENNEEDDKEVERQLLNALAPSPSGIPSSEPMERNMSPSYPFPIVDPSSVPPLSPASYDQTGVSQPPAEASFAAHGQALPPPANGSAGAFPNAVLMPSAPEAEDVAGFPNMPSAPFAHPTNVVDVGNSSSPPSAPPYQPFSPLPSTSTPPPAPRPDKALPQFSAGLQTPAKTPATYMPSNLSTSAAYESEQMTQPEAFSASVVNQTVKHAKFAISALNYDDYEEARKQLRSALLLLGG